MRRPRVKCPRCSKRRTMQTAMLWRFSPDDEFVPVCSECWQELMVEQFRHAEAVRTPGPR